MTPTTQAQCVPHQWVVAEQVQPRRLSGRGELDDQEQQREDDPGQREQARSGPRQQRRHLDTRDPRAGVEGWHQQAETDTGRDV